MVSAISFDGEVLADFLANTYLVSDETIILGEISCKSETAGPWDGRQCRKKLISCRMHSDMNWMKDQIRVYFRFVNHVGPSLFSILILLSIEARHKCMKGDYLHDGYQLKRKHYMERSKDGKPYP